MVADWTRTQTALEIINTLSAQHVPAEQVLTPEWMYDIPQLDARGYYEEVEHPVTGPHRYPGWPFRMTPGPSRHHRFAPPTLGQHNEEILRGLGVTDDELEELRARRVIGATAAERIAVKRRYSLVLPIVPARSSRSAWGHWALNSV